jgi:hypothetical protein
LTDEDIKNEAEKRRLEMESQTEIINDQIIE